MLFQSCETKFKIPEFENSEWKTDTIKVNDFRLIRAKSKFETKGLIRLNNSKLFAGDNFVDSQYFDINNDGYEDIRAYYLENDFVRAVSFFYDNEINDFKEILNINSTFEYLNDNFYYSYSELGCEGWNWESTLIKIIDFKSKSISKIIVDDCDDKKDGVFVYDLVNNEIELRNVLPHSIELIQKSDTRFEFIKSYWAQNYESE
jgi:hypothetical protein